MKDKKQIEEMAKVIEAVKLYGNDNYERKISHDSALELAKELLKYYQPKLPENAVVLTMGEYDLLTDIKSLQLQVQDSLYNMSNEDIANITKQVRKETVEKILKLLDNMYVKEDDRHYWREHNNDCIDKCKAKIAKQFGVEIGE